MKFSNETISILKNFAMINPSIQFKPGSIIRTMHPQKSIMAMAKVTEEIEGKAAIYDLSRFLATLTLFDDPEVTFGDDKFIIASDRSKVSYTYAAEDMIVKASDKNIKLPSSDATFKLSWKDLDSVIKAAGVLKLSEICFTVEDDKITVSAVDVKNPTADSYSVVVAEEGAFTPCKVHVKVENLRLIASDYTVTLSSIGLAHFESPKVEYWIALAAAK